jgi:uncharacterized protein YecE (DUF72 family)
MDGGKYIIGTSGYSFADWVGEFYPPGTRQKDMFSFYAGSPGPTLERLAAASPEGFRFWAKGNQELTHKGNLAAAPPFLEHLSPMRDAEKLAGLLLQFPQSFHRTVESRKYLSSLLEKTAAVPVAVEFRHRSWDHASVAPGLRERGVTLVVPDTPRLEGLYRPPPVLTSRTGYLRLHSRDAEQWYGGMAERYDYNYSDEELKKIVEEWSAVEEQAGKVYAFFNNCHRGQAARNAESMRRILGQIQ